MSALGPVTFRLYLDGVLADEQTADASDYEAVGRIAEHQGSLCGSTSQRYLVEVAFSDGDHVRWGTDAAGMVLPQEVAFSQLARKFGPFG